VAGNRLISRALGQARERVREGEEMALSLRASGLFPSVVLEMVSVGEKTGELSKMLEKVSFALENEAESDLRSLIALLEPLMILIMGVGVGSSPYPFFFHLGDESDDPLKKCGMRNSECGMKRQEICCRFPVAS